jgi:nucleoside-diphosphate-sugar epimerase
MNLALAIGTYAGIVKELGLPLYFPGSRVAFETMTQIIDADQVGQAALWATTTDGASDQVLNIANGDPTRWSLFWPEIAAYMKVRYDEITTLIHQYCSQKLNEEYAQLSKSATAMLSRKKQVL